MAIRERYLLEALAFLVRARVSAYHLIRSSLQLLVPSREELDDLIKRCNVDAQVLNTPMTTNANRRHLLIQF